MTRVMVPAAPQVVGHAMPPGSSCMPPPNIHASQADFVFPRGVCNVHRVLAGLSGFLGGFVGVWFCLFLWVGHGCGVSAVFSRLGPGLTWGLWLGKVLWLSLIHI